MVLKRRFYLFALKCQAVELAEENMKEAVARQFGVDPQRIRPWCSEKDHLAKLKKDISSWCMKLVGGGCNIKDEEMAETWLTGFWNYTGGIELCIVI